MLPLNPERKESFPRSPLRRKGSPSLQLSSRDLEILRFFEAIRFAETAYFSAALVPQSFPTEEKLRRRLRKLARDGYLDLPARRIAPARAPQFLLTDAPRLRGRPEHIWALAQRGADLLKLKGQWNRNNARLRPTAFQHPLMIARVYTALQVAARKGLLELDQWTGENNWRDYIRVNGESLPLIPDAVFVLSEKRTGRELVAFLETDNSTEPLRRTTMAQSSFYKKCLAYWQHWADELRFKETTTLVLTIAKTPERAHALRLTAQTIDEKERGLYIFWFTDESSWKIAEPEQFLYEPIWTTATGERQAIFGAALPCLPPPPVFPDRPST